MDYRIHKTATNIASLVGIALVTLQCFGNAIPVWHLSPFFVFIWSLPPAVLTWFFLTFKRAEWRRIDPHNPFWEATGDDYIKLMVIGTFSMVLEFVFSLK